MNKKFKPSLPNNYSEVAAKLNLPDNKINKDIFSYKQIIKKITDTFDTTEIPVEWISSSIPNLPSLQEAKDYLISKDCDLTLPLVESQLLGSQIKRLRTFFYFDILPSEFIKISALPEPGIVLLPPIF